MKYLTLPVMQCDPGCPDCCGPVFCRPEEFDAVKRYAAENGIAPVRQGLQCPMFQNGGCTVYRVRPFICRLFGHTPALRCSKGYNKNVTPERESAVKKQYKPELATVMLHELCFSLEEILVVLESELPK